mgnify:CR=1 FL=1
MDKRTSGTPQDGGTGDDLLPWLPLSRQQDRGQDQGHRPPRGGGAVGPRLPAPSWPSLSGSAPAGPAGPTSPGAPPPPGRAPAGPRPRRPGPPAHLVAPARAAPPRPLAPGGLTPPRPTPATPLIPRPHRQVFKESSGLIHHAPVRTIPERQVRRDLVLNVPRGLTPRPVRTALRALLPALPGPRPHRPVSGVPRAPPPAGAEGWRPGARASVRAAPGVVPGRP